STRIDFDIERQMIIVCPPSNLYGTLLLWAPSKKYDFNQVLQWRGKYGWMVFPKPVEEATGISTLGFYNRFKAPYSVYCFETPYEIWWPEWLKPGN
ncbi:MAG TPA: hypothetical protein VFF78_02940, partial [Anaerolineaceae bacterium]|nr:hypothetical protein [Anaerolineaceae bacterium]